MPDKSDNIGSRRSSGESANRANGSAHRFFIRWYPFLIPAGVLLFYLPFIPREFMGDDWLWLAHAEKTLAEPSLLLSRPIYGYFRPLYMIYIGVLQNVFGMQAFAFALANLAFHLLNCYMVARVLVRLGLSHSLTALSSILFGFYFLTCPAVCWISAGSDLVTLTLMLTFILLLINYYEAASLKRFLLVTLTGLAATLVKEVGFVSVLLFFMYPFLRKQNPFRKGYSAGAILILLLFAGYLVFYFNTRSFIDKELVTDTRVFINLWFLATYQVLPISARMVGSFGESMHQLLYIVRAGVTISLPLLWVWLFIKRGVAVRMFLLWPLLFLGPVAMFDWNVGLFDLYPERTASRYMYIAVPGTAVLISVIIPYLYGCMKKWKPVAVGALVLFLMGNLAAVYKVTRTYQVRQSESTHLFEQLSLNRAQLEACDSLVIIPDDVTNYPALFEYPRVLEAMCYLVTDTNITVTLRTDSPSGESLAPPEPCVFRWLSSERRFLPTTPDCVAR